MWPSSFRSKRLIVRSLPSRLTYRFCPPSPSVPAAKSAKESSVNSAGGSAAASNHAVAPTKTGSRHTSRFITTSEVGGRRSEGGGQRSEVGRQRLTSLQGPPNL